MIWKNYKFTALIGILAIALFADGAIAQSAGGYANYGARSMMFLALSRALIILVAVGGGLSIGWILSPNSKKFRKVGIFILLSAVILIASFNNGLIGWWVTIGAAIIGFFFGIGYWLRSSGSQSNDSLDTFGSSRWATPRDLHQYDVYGAEGIRLGEAFNDRGLAEVISYKGDRHLLTVAPTRSGKGTTQIIPNLLTYEGSMFVIDPKGENAMITAKRRNDMGQDVHIVDPWGIVQIEGIETSSFNPLDWLQITDIDITENAMLLADALVVGENHSDSFWNEEAKALLQGFILYVATAREEDGKRTLSRVRELLLLDSNDLEVLFNKMAGSGHPIVKSTGNRSLQKEKKLLSNVLASAQAQTHFLDSDRLRDNLKTSSFKFEDLKTKSMTVYLVLPADRLDAFGRWLRLLVQQAITVNARDIETKPEKPVLFVLDEFAALGRLSMIEQAYGLMAGFGMQLWGIVQDFNQLERIYGDGWQSFVANAGMINYFGSSDQKTAEYFSSLCGETTVWSFSSAVASTFGSSSGSSGNTSSSGSSDTDTHSAAQRKLAYPDELMRMNDSMQIAFIDKMHPLQADKVKWFDDPDLKDLGVNLYQDK
ncbi:MAG: type IV secretory system conjugative DNA transfer family protein [Cohaesibacter sp.]|nr:type IV secretory system conjugative DNA transfer family protein [Cohaesibacter sp.]